MASTDKYGHDAFRYFLLREMNFGLDASFSEEAFVARLNADLANDLGNLASRATTMIVNFGGGAVPAAPSAFNGNASGGPSVAVAHYDPRTGEYMTPDGQMHQVKNLADGGAPKSWKDLLPF